MPLIAGVSCPPIMTGMSAPTTSLVTRGARVTRVFVHLLRGLLIAAAVFSFLGPAPRRKAVRDWSASLLRLLGVRLHVQGSPPAARGKPVMLVGNHVSWLDVFVINAVLPVRFVAKSEVRSWPLIGWLSARTGTLFIERARRRDAMRINRRISEVMRGGDVIAVFPEGTTTDGSHLLRFHSALLQPALLAEAAVHPVALRFERADGSLCVEAAYDGDKTLWDTVRLMVTQPVIHARVWFLPALPADTAHRRELAQTARSAIVNCLGF